VCLFSFLIAISKSDALGSGISGSAVFMYVYLPNISNPIDIEELREMVSPPNQNTVGVCNQITLLILYYISSRMVTILKINDDPIQVSDIYIALLVSQVHQL